MTSGNSLNGCAFAVGDGPESTLFTTLEDGPLLDDFPKAIGGGLGKSPILLTLRLTIGSAGTNGTALSFGSTFKSIFSIWFDEVLACEFEFTLLLEDEGKLCLMEGGMGRSLMDVTLVFNDSKFLASGACTERSLFLNALEGTTDGCRTVFGLGVVTRL